MKQDRSPRWAKWHLMPEVKLWEAVALSLNIEPTKIETSSTAWMGAEHPFDEGEAFNDRLDVLRVNLRNKTYFSTPCTLSLSAWYQCGVSLSEFIAFAVNVASWTIPDELAELNKVETVPTNDARLGKAEATVSKTTHKIGNRSNALNAVVMSAQNTAIDPTDYHSVWAELVKLAESNQRPSPLLGFVEDDGIKYQTEKGVKFFTKKNLADRMRRAKTR